ncbi:MAG: hypothetical protein AAB533_00145 [Patescibacteria group bacterium]
MYNWSTDEKSLPQGSEAHTIWRLEQAVNFGLHGERLSEAELRKYLPRLSLDPHRRAFLELLLYGD